MSGTPRTTIKPGDLVIWVEDRDIDATVTMLITDDGERFQFQFARQAWDEMTFDGTSGLTVREAESVLRGEAQFRLPGYIYKAYDEESGRSFPDPSLEAAE